MGPRLTRRGFLALPFLSLMLPRLSLVRPVRALGETVERTVRAYDLNVGVLFNLLTYSVTGSVTVEVDRATGSYRVTVSGAGPGVVARSESAGIIRDGRFMPTSTRSSHTVRGRENWLKLTYDYDRGAVRYQVVSHTFLLGRRWGVDDVLRLPPGQHVDDLISAALNFANGSLDVDHDGAFRMTLVRRARSAHEKPDEVSPSGYHAEFATVRFHAAPDPTGRLTALVDLTGFSSWARPASPAHVVFGSDRYLESATSSLILGTTFTLHLAPPS
ncbi:MAG TPA: hypothetical protein VMS64_00320 [Candidatus Methylomirabilis sp.]|nr:hypothetical protein [Candidatus Methylomirabilis sp.]